MIQYGAMAVSSLKYRPGAETPQESKQGYIVLNGDPNDYHHWVFRTKLKMKTSREEDLPKVASNVVENLRGETLWVAVEIGIDRFTKDSGSGLQDLMDKMSKHILPNCAARVQ